MNPTEYWNGVSAPYQIEQSLRFNSADSAYLSRIHSASNQKLWTWSGWVKRGKLASGFLFYTRWQSGNSQGGIFFAGDTLRYFARVSGSDKADLYTTSVFRDPSAWYHVVAVLDAANTSFKFYVNNVEQPLTTVTSVQNADHAINHPEEHNLGNEPTQSGYFDGYMSEVHFVDGAALDPTDFGELDDNGVWRPIKYAGSYTGNSFYLKFASGDGTDSSGLSNTWTANNFTTSGTGTDVMSDTPTTNWATLNVLGKALSDSGSGTTSDGNLQITYSSYSWYGHKSTIAVSSGKWYYEVTNTTGTIYVYAGFSHVTANSENASNVYRYRSNGTKKGTSATSYGAAWSTAGDICGVAFDADAGTIEFYKNGVSQGTAFSSIPAGEYAAEVMVEGSTTAVVNFGQRAFAYTPPTGFKALNTSNLPAPTIKDGSDYFGTVLYSGDGGTSNTVTGLSFTPDVVWGKSRSNALPHNIFDVVRGFDKQLDVNDTVAEVDRAGDAVTPLSNGFTLDATYCNINNSSTTNVAWSWLAGGSGSSNTDGTITSTVSANPSAGFSIVSYTGTGVNATVGHGLGVAPSMTIVKKRSAANGWIIGHSSVGWGNYLVFDTDGAGANSTIWQDTAPTSTVFSVGTNTTVNGLSATFIAYCFAEVEGYSKFGSYTGNGSTDGPFVATSFTPSWVMLKRSDSSGTDWIIQDAARSTYNVVDDILRANTSQAEASGNSNYYIDFLSNGIKLRTTSAAWNASGGTYVFACFASNPFGGSGVSPATAR